MRVSDLHPNDFKSCQVYRYVDDETDEIERYPCSSIENHSGYFLISGEITLADGSKYPAILGISSDDSGEMFEFYLYQPEKGWLSNADNLSEKLNKARTEIFSLKYHLNVSVQGDVHSDHQY
jgi:hypothetical protein